LRNRSGAEAQSHFKDFAAPFDHAQGRLLKSCPDTSFFFELSFSAACKAQLYFKDFAARLNNLVRKCLARTNLVRGNPARAEALVHFAGLLGMTEVMP
jgi:hypothetical protein